MILSFKYVIYFAALFLSCVAMVTYANQPANNIFDTPVPLGGYAWSANIGWVSFDGANYGVDIKPDRKIEGHAWSSNIGWIEFGGLAGCPSGTCSASVDFATNKFQGWARALAQGDGWDGWISLSGDATDGSPYGLTVTSSGTFTNDSYAWGSDVVGWKNFSNAFFDTPCAVENVCSADGADVETTNIWCEVIVNECALSEMCYSGSNACESGSDSLTVTPMLVKRGETVDVSWTTFNSVYDLGSCRVEGPGGPWESPSGTNQKSGPIMTTGVTFTLYCDSAGVETEVDSQAVKMLPSIYEI